MLFNAEGKWVDVAKVNCEAEFSDPVAVMECELTKQSL